MNKISLFAICVLASVATTFAFWSYHAQPVTASIDSGLPIKELRLFSNIYSIVKSSYVDDVEDSKLIQGAIDGMLDVLDPYSAYLKKDLYKNLKVGTTGKFGGLGIEVDMKDGLIEIVAPIDDTPASKAGLRAGDLITQIDDNAVKDMKLSDAVKLMRGKIGTKVKIVILREGLDKPIEMELQRAEIKIKSTNEALLEPDYGYIRISRFQTQTLRHLEKSFNKIKKENKKPLKGLVLDLRNNPGGVLEAAVGVVDFFVADNQLVVYTKGRHSSSGAEYKAKRSDQSNGIPLIVLINKGSASASEITAGALQDYKRATLMGEKSYGKGSVQTIHTLEKDAALKLTTAKYYTPSGKVIHGEGVSPDIKLEFKELTEEQIAERKKLNIRKDFLQWLSYDSQVKEAIAKLKTLVATK